MVEVKEWGMKTPLTEARQALPEWPRMSPSLSAISSSMLLLVVSQPASHLRLVLVLWQLRSQGFPLARQLHRRRCGQVAENPLQCSASILTKPAIRSASALVRSFGTLTSVTTMPGRIGIAER